LDWKKLISPVEVWEPSWKAKGEAGKATATATAKAPA
jgi:hypothetical protein